MKSAFGCVVYALNDLHHSSIWRVSSLFFVFLSTANALAIDTPSHSWVIGETVTEYWETTSPDDPAYFSLELRSSDSIFSLVDNIPTSSGSVTFTVPHVYPG